MNYRVITLSRKNIEALLSSNSLTEAIGKISSTPIGSILHRIVEKKYYTILDLFGEINRFYVEQKKILTQHGAGLRIIDDFENVFDLINSLSIVKSLEINKTPVPLVPFGKTASIWYEMGRNERRMVEELNIVIKSLAKRRITSAIDLIAMAPRLSDKYSLDYNLKKTFGFLRDSTLLSICITCEEELEQIPLLLSLFREDFINICKVRNLAELPRLLNGLNPIYDKFSEVLNDVFKAHVSLESYYLALFITLQIMAQNLRLKREQEVTRHYLLLSSESVVLRWILLCLDSGLLIDETRSILNKWWFVV